MKDFSHSKIRPFVVRAAASRCVQLMSSMKTTTTAAAAPPPKMSQSASCWPSYIALNAQQQITATRQQAAHLAGCFF